jgi:hypothetical protein
MAIDGHWVNILSLLLAFLAIPIKPVRRKIAGMGLRFHQKEAIFDCLSGATITPFLLMIGSTFSKSLLEVAVAEGQIFIAIGGVVGLIAIIGDLFGSPNHPV